jgi:hypothetical protein
MDESEYADLIAATLTARFLTKTALSATAIRRVLAGGGAS